MLTRWQKTIRGTLFGAFALALLWGTAWGNDVHFPFGPFRMYSTSTVDYIHVMELHAVTTEGTSIELPPSAFGLRRAEFEGQRTRFVEDPSLLEDAVHSYEAVRPQSPTLSELELVHVVYRLIDDRPVLDESRVLASWQR